jgi:cation transporter-like permease
MDRSPLDRFIRNTEARLVVGFFVLLYVVGGGLIWAFYGRGAALLGMACMTTGLVFFLLLYAIVTVLGKWAGE